MSARRVSASPTKRRSQLPRFGLVLVVAACVFVTVGLGVSLLSDPTPVRRPAEGLSAVDRASAVDVAVDLVVTAGYAGARSSAALRSTQRRYYARTVAPGLEALTVRAAEQQRRALLRAAPARVGLLERTVPIGTRITRFESSRASVAVWTVQMAGPASGRRAPGAWWLTTRVDLVPEDGAWKVQNAVALQGPTPRLVRAQQAGVGTNAELRGMLQTTERILDAP